MSEFAITLPAELVEAVAQRAVAIVMEGGAGGSKSPWMTRGEAADYLRLPISRLEKDRRLPCHRDASRVLYNRHELDAYFLSLGRDGD